MNITKFKNGNLNLSTEFEQTEGAILRSMDMTLSNIAVRRKHGGYLLIDNNKDLKYRLDDSDIDELIYGRTVKLTPLDR